MHMLSRLLPVYVCWHSLTQKLQCNSSNVCACFGILSIDAYWWTASSYVACVLCTSTCKCWVTISLTVQSLYLPDSTTSSISAVSGSSADFTAVCLCNVICLGCAASDRLVTWTGSPAGLMLWLDEFVFCAKMSSAKKCFCSKGAHCALSTWYDNDLASTLPWQSIQYSWQDHCCSMELHVCCSRPVCHNAKLFR